MIYGLYFSVPQLLWLIPLILILGAFYVRAADQNRLFAATRIIIFCLIIAAAANPYFVEINKVKSSTPTMTILDDKTGSMAIFDPEMAARLSALTGAQIRSFSGNTTPLGDKIIQYSQPGETLILVSDGYSNSGRPLADSLSLSKASNTTIFAISQDPIREDASVEISGTNTAVLGGDYAFRVIVRSSGSYRGKLSVFADERLIYADNVVANGTTSIKISHVFLETGSHVLRASITPDFQPVNNNYQKAIYVVPKPDVLLVSDGNSPLAKDLAGLYKLNLESEIPASLEIYKTIVLDNQKYDTKLDGLKDYVRNGGGLVVVGGQDAYELGGYENSSLEAVLPVRSFPSTFEGGKTVIFVLDISFSLLGTRAKDGTPLLDYEKALALELLKSPDFKDYKVGVIVFGTKAYDVVDPIPLSRGESVIKERIASLSPSGTENTYLDNGLQLAWEMLNNSGGQGELVVISDGNLWNYEDVFQHSVKLLRNMNITTRLMQVQAIPGETGRLEDMATQTGSEYTAFIYPASLTTRIQGQPEKKPEEKKPSSGYSLSITNKNHYITYDLDLNVTISGFNDVTPKAGSQKLVAMADGKPVLNVWRYGLGRVASLTTDDGNTWAGSLYSAPYSQMISSMVNWAIGDPRPKDDRVEAEDGWLGTPLQITILSDAQPRLPGASIEKVGDRRYMATLTPDRMGNYYIGDYGIAVNYPLEYRDIGYNPDFPKLIMSNGGKVFTEDEAKQSVIAEASRLSERTIQERVSRRPLLLLTALVIFVAEVVLRKLGEIKRRGRSKA